jgi:uncharacterized repeat protein (TIGR04076 family)
MPEKKEKNKLILKVHKIKGKCPVYKEGDKTVIMGAQIDLDKSDKVCVHALVGLGPFIVALRDGLDPKELGLSKKSRGPAYYQCLDPGEPWTDGGTVIFRITQK